MNRIEISKRIRELKELMQMREELNAEIEHIQDQIKYEMQKEGIEEMQCGIFKVKYTTVKSNRFDTQTFKKTIPVAENSASFPPFPKQEVNKVMADTKAAAKKFNFFISIYY